MNSRLAVALSAAMLGATVFASPVQAQGSFAGMRGSAVQSRSSGHFRGGRRGGTFRLRGRRPLLRGPVFGQSPYFYLPYLYSDYGSAPDVADVTEEAPPRIVVIQAAQPAVQAPAVRPHDALVLELQGDHWVRLTSYSQSQVSQQSIEEDSAQTSPRQATFPRQDAVAETPHELPPVMLVFRDGHKEQAEKYTVIGAVIYMSADYWNSGSWTTKVPIAELNVPATLKLNQDRGVRFSLPSGPNEVIVRP